MKNIWKRLSIRHKITSIIVLIILLVTITIIPVISYLIKDALLRQQQNHLESVKNLVIKLFEDYQSKVTNYTKLFSNDREIKDTLFYHTELAGEREHPLRAITRLFKSFDVSTIEIGDARGRVVAVAETPEKHEYDRSQDPLIKSALQGKAMSGIVPSEKGFIIKATAPIYYNENQIVGTITSGILLDDSLLSKIKQMSGTDLVIVDSENHTISSTLRYDRGAGVQKDSNAMSEKGLSGKLIVKFPLSDMGNAIVGSVMVIQEDRLPGIIAKTRITLLLLLMSISTTSVFVLFLVLNRVMMPVIRLREGAERIGKGEFGYRIEVASKDEIGELSEGFNTMAKNLETLRVMEEKLSQAERLAAIGKFAAGIAHEINNPIGNMIGIAKLMQRDIQNKKLREDIESIIKDADRCARITKDLLAYSRQSPPQKERVFLNTIVDDTVTAVKHLADSKSIDIRKELYADLPEIHIDALQISQVLNNILLNAVQSIEFSGSITIKTMHLDNMVEISIADTGCGIDDTIKDKIFYPFFTTKAVGEGTGLGLAISYGIIQNHGGEIIAESRKGQGSTFRIRLPVGERNG